MLNYLSKNSELWTTSLFALRCYWFAIELMPSRWSYPYRTYVPMEVPPLLPEMKFSRGHAKRDFRLHPRKLTRQIIAWPKRAHRWPRLTPTQVPVWWKCLALLQIIWIGYHQNMPELLSQTEGRTSVTLPETHKTIAYSKQSVSRQRSLNWLSLSELIFWGRSTFDLTV